MYPSVLALCFQICEATFCRRPNASNMTDISDNKPGYASVWSPARPNLVALLCLHTVMCCISLLFVPEQITYQKTAAIYDSAHFIGAVLNTASFAPVAFFFTLSRFSFGYLLGFYFYTMILGYLWLLAFSEYRYDHALAQISIFFSALAFLAPATLITSPIRQRFVLSTRALDFLLSFILLLAATTVTIGASYNFKLIAVSISTLPRRNLSRIPELCDRHRVNALLPFAFACFITLGKPWRAGQPASASDTISRHITKMTLLRHAGYCF